MQKNTRDGKEKIIIFDTTLRDGEQCPGASMTFEQKIEVAEMLDTMGVDVIEAGFPANGDDDFRAVSEIAKRAKNATICALARATERDIKAAGRAIQGAKKKRIHTFIATSPLHMKRKLNMAPEKVLEAVSWSVGLARNFVDDVEWSCEDGTQSEREFLYRCIEAAIKAGATTINIPDTCGYTEPEEYRELFKSVREKVPNSDKAIFSVHCHNDLGMAVANSLYGVHGGARQIECTMNGIGERAGNAALEEIVMAIRTRGDRFPFYTDINTTLLTPASKLVSQVTSFPVQYNKAIVGKNAFAHASGIHQDGMFKDKGMYEIMRPEDVGLKGTSIVMTKHSGRHAFVEKLKELGYQVGDNQANDAFARFKEIANRKKVVSDEDIEALVDDGVARAHDSVKLLSLVVVAGTPAQLATITLDVEGVHKTEMATGNGPIDAIFAAIKKVIPHEAELELYQVHAVTGGTDAQAEVSVRLKGAERSYSATGHDLDTLVASAKAYLGALCKFVAREVREKPSDVVE